MTQTLTKKRQLLIAALGFSLLFGGCLGGKKTAKNRKTSKAGDLNASAEPDKVLYDRALEDLKHNRYIEGRLSLQTLINTYPDSEYLAKAKLAIADSFYKEGGTTNTIEAIAEYKDFITFFPFLDEAAYAQMQVGMAHYRMMEKPDRDNTQVQQAEDEFQTMLLKYPQSPLAPQAEQRLREVQEVLAEGEYRIAHFYYTKDDLRAAAARLQELTERYPLYSQSDDAWWMLGDIYTRARQMTKNEDDRNRWRDLAGLCYIHLVRNYPLSRRASEAKARLKVMGIPIPPADPNALARMQKEQLYSRNHPEHGFIKMPLGMLKSNPDVSMAAHSGQPNLNPPSDTISASDILKPGGSGSSITATTTGGGGATSAEDVGTSASASSAASQSAPTAAAGVEIISAPTDPNAPMPASTGTPPAANPPTVPPSDTPPSETSTAPASASQGEGASGESKPGSATSSASASGQTDSQAEPQPQTKKAASKQESTSKKKKGLRKLIPW